MVEFLKKVFTFTLHVFTEAICLLYRFQELRQTTTSFCRLWFSHPVFFFFSVCKMHLKMAKWCSRKRFFFWRVCGVPKPNNDVQVSLVEWNVVISSSVCILCMQQQAEAATWHGSMALKRGLSSVWTHLWIVELGLICCWHFEPQTTWSLSLQTMIWREI